MMQIGAQGIENMLIFDEKKKLQKNTFWKDTFPFHLE
jgi:hypothetical protein